MYKHNELRYVYKYIFKEKFTLYSFYDISYSAANNCDEKKFCFF